MHQSIGYTFGVVKQIKKLHVFAFAWFQALLTGLLGVICGVLYSFGGLVIDVLVSLGWLSPEKMGTPGLSHGTLLAFGALVGMPVLFFVAGFALGVLEALLYNVVARWAPTWKVFFLWRDSLFHTE